MADWTEVRMGKVEVVEIGSPPASPPVTMVSTPATCDRCGAQIHAPTTGTVGDKCPFCPEGRLKSDEEGECADSRLRCPPDVETATGTFEPAGYHPQDCAGCGLPKSAHIFVKEGE